MAQTKEGVRKVKELYGRDHYKKIGKLGGNPLLLAIREEKLKRGEVAENVNR